MFPIDIKPGVDMLEQIRQMTDDEFYHFCQDNAAFHFERDVTGTIKPIGQTGGETGRRKSELLIELGVWNRQTKLGFVHDSSTGFRLSNGAVRSPDVAWVSAEPYNALSIDQRRKFPPLCPDFLVELVSQSDSQKDVETKMAEYIANGCRLAWLINPKTQTAHVYRANGSVDVLGRFDGTLSGEVILPGFTLPLSLL